MIPRLSRLERFYYDAFRLLYGADMFLYTVVTCMFIQEGVTPLMHSAFKGRQAICEMLLEHGADINFRASASGVCMCVHIDCAI